MKKKVKCESVHVNNVNCLLYADDIVILLESESGLQTCLDSVWLLFKLEITSHCEKSKIMIINSKSNPQSNIFTFNTDTIQVVSKDCY